MGRRGRPWEAVGSRGKPWETNVQTTGVVEYGTSQGNYHTYAYEAGTKWGSQHSINLFNLQAGTQYSFIARSMSIDGTVYQSQEGTFTGLSNNPSTLTVSMIDISDGLVTDLTHICEASGVGANLDSKKIPISAAAKRRKGTALHHALYDGEDYELLFTTKSSIASRITTQKRGRIIGEVISKRSVFLDGKPLVRGGWEHTWR